MPLWIFWCCIEGYRERYRDSLSLAVLTGFYSGYYNNSKRPLGPTQIIARMNKRADNHSDNDVDMDAEIARIQQLDQKFQSAFREG